MLGISSGEVCRKKRASCFDPIGDLCSHDVALGGSSRIIARWGCPQSIEHVVCRSILDRQEIDFACKVDIGSESGYCTNLVTQVSSRSVLLVGAPRVEHFDHVGFVRQVA